MHSNETGSRGQDSQSEAPGRLSNTRALTVASPPCRRPKPGGKRCGRPRCTSGCRTIWAWKWSRLLQRSFRACPPTHFLTLGARALDRKGWTHAQRRFTLRLRRRAVDYLLVVEWTRAGRRHLHLLLRAPQSLALTASLVGEWWAASLPPGGQAQRSYCRPVENPAAAARYVVKDVQQGGVVPPRSFRGRLITYSRHFLARPAKVLLREDREERWLGRIRRWVQDCVDVGALRRLAAVATERLAELGQAQASIMPA